MRLQSDTTCAGISSSSKASDEASGGSIGWTNTATVVPGALLRGGPHSLQAAVHVAALHLAPQLPAAWLQWGNALISWSRQLRQLKLQQPLPAHATSMTAMMSTTPQIAAAPKHVDAMGQAAGVLAGDGGGHSGSEEDAAQLAVCGAHALCMWLRVSASQRALAVPEDALPVLLRVLQVRAAHGFSSQCAACHSCTHTSHQHTPGRYGL
jgi:hypothetical protein